MPRIGLQKFLIPAADFFPAAVLTGTPVASTTESVSDWDSARVTFTYTVANGTCRASLSVYGRANSTATFYQIGTSVSTVAGVSVTTFIDVDVRNVGQIKVEAVEVGNTGAGGTFSSTLTLRHNRGQANLDSVDLVAGFNRLLPTTSFTAQNGGGSASATTGIVSLPNAVATSTFANTPQLARDHGGDPFAYSCAVQLKSFTAGTGAQQAIMATGHDGVNPILVGTGAVGTVRVWNNGFIDCFINSTATVTSRPAGTALLDGQDWIRVDSNAGVVTFYIGRGVSYDAVSWTIIASRTASVSLAPKVDTASAKVILGLTAAPGPVGTCSVQFSDVYWRDLP